MKGRGERKMAIASKLTSIGMITLSLVLGFLSFYLLSDFSKEKKKRHMEELTSQFINFIIFIWLGKIMLNFPIFISDPMAILAYPSDSNAFYFAIVFIILFLLYKKKRKKLDVLSLLESFVHVFLISSFVYEFIQIVVEDNTYAFGYFILLVALIGIFFFFRERMNITVLLMVLITIWSIGLMILALTQPFVTVFGFTMTPWFIGVFFVISMISLTNQLRKRDA